MSTEPFSPPSLQTLRRALRPLSLPEVAHEDETSVGVLARIRDRGSDRYPVQRLLHAAASYPGGR